MGSVVADDTGAGQEPKLADAGAPGTASDMATNPSKKAKPAEEPANPEREALEHRFLDHAPLQSKTKTALCFYSLLLFALFCPWVSFWLFGCCARRLGQDLRLDRRRADDPAGFEAGERPPRGALDGAPPGRQRFLH